MADFERANKLAATVYFKRSSYKRDVYDRLEDTARPKLSAAMNAAAELVMSKQIELFETTLATVCAAMQAEIPSDVPVSREPVTAMAIEIAIAAIGAFVQKFTVEAWTREDAIEECAKEMA